MRRPKQKPNYNFFDNKMQIKNNARMVRGEKPHVKQRNFQICPQCRRRYQTIPKGSMVNMKPNGKGGFTITSFIACKLCLLKAKEAELLKTINVNRAGGKNTLMEIKREISEEENEKRTETVNC